MITELVFRTAVAFRGTPPAYWPMCKFDLILATLSALTSGPARHLPLFNE